MEPHFAARRPATLTNNPDIAMIEKEKNNKKTRVESRNTMSSWADEANGESSVDQENFKAERIISQTPDGREKVKMTTFISSIFRRVCATAMERRICEEAWIHRERERKYFLGPHYYALTHVKGCETTLLLGLR